MPHRCEPAFRRTIWDNELVACEGKFRCYVTFLNWTFVVINQQWSKPWKYFVLEILNFCSNSRKLLILIASIQAFPIFWAIMLLTFRLWQEPVCRWHAVIRIRNSLGSAVVFTHSSVSSMLNVECRFQVTVLGFVFISFLLWSDIRSEGSIAIVKKFDFHFLLISILYQYHILKKWSRKKSVCVYVCACLSVYLSVLMLPNIEPKLFDRFR